MNLDDRNETLNKKIEHTDLQQAVTTLVKDAKRSKVQVRLLTISILLDLLLTIGLGFLSVKTHSIANRAESNQEAIIQSCTTTNDARANNRVLWDYLLALPPVTAQTPQQTKQHADFAKIVDKTFAPRDCSKVVQ